MSSDAGAFVLPVFSQLVTGVASLLVIASVTVVASDEQRKILLDERSLACYNRFL